MIQTITAVHHIINVSHAERTKLSGPSFARQRKKRFPSITRRHSRPTLQGTAAGPDQRPLPSTTYARHWHRRPYLRPPPPSPQRRAPAAAPTCARRRQIEVSEEEEQPVIELSEEEERPVRPRLRRPRKGAGGRARFHSASRNRARYCQS